MDQFKITTVIRESFELNKAGHFTEALSLIDGATAKWGYDSIPLRLNYVVALIGLERWEEAELRLKPLLDDSTQYDSETSKAIYCNQALIECHTNRELQGVQRLLDLVNQWPDDEILLINAGLHLTLGHRHSEAEQLLISALKINPEREQTLVGLANCYQRQGKDKEAIQIFDQALKFNPKSCKITTNKSLSLLRLRCFEEGWKAFESRPQSWNLNWLNADWQPGTPLLGRSIAVIVDEGIGDAIMFSPMLEQVACLARDHVIYCDGRIIELFKRTWPRLKFESQILDDRYKNMDYRVRLGSLTNLFRCKEEQFLPSFSGLKPDPTRVRYYKSWLEQMGPAPKIGIGWRGGQHDHYASQVRSIPLSSWTPLLTAQPTHWICLQHNPDQDEIAATELQAGVKIHQVSGVTNNIDDLAALVSALNGVMSCEQTAVHVAGGVGTPCWVLMSETPGWRYIAARGGENNSMIWYDTVKLLPKEQWDSWDKCIDIIKTLESQTSITT